MFFDKSPVKQRPPALAGGDLPGRGVVRSRDGDAARPRQQGRSAASPAQAPARGAPECVALGYRRHGNRACAPGGDVPSAAGRGLPALPAVQRARPRRTPARSESEAAFTASLPAARQLSTLLTSGDRKRSHREEVSYRHRRKPAGNGFPRLPPPRQSSTLRRKYLTPNTYL